MKRLLLYTLLISTISAFGQTWNTIGGGLNPNASFNMKVEVYNNEIYVVETYFLQASLTTEVRVSKWNGLSWSSLPSYTLPVFIELGDIAFYQGDLYVGLIRNSGNFNRLLKFDGTLWSVVPFSVSTSVVSIRSLEVHNGELYIGGVFSTTIGPTTFNNIMKFDGVNYSALPGLNSVLDLQSHNGNIYCAANDSVYYWTGSAWDNPTSFVQGSSTTNPRIKVLGSDNNNLYGYGVLNNIFLLNTTADSAKFIGTVNYKVTDMELHNNELYALGDTTWSPFALGGGVAKINGSIVTPILATPPGLRVAASYQGELYAFSSSTLTFNNITYNKAFRTNANFSLLSGVAFIDQNNDCFYNTNESVIPNTFFEVNGTMTSTDANGFYSFALPAGAYTLDTFFLPLAIGKNFSISCSLPNQINVGSGQNITQNLPVTNNVPIDAQVFLTGFSGWRARHGFTEGYRLDFNNAGNSTLPSATVKVELPPTVTFISSTPLPNTINGNILEYNFLNVQPSVSKKVTLQVKIDTSQNAIGDTLYFKSYITGVNGDADLSDNADTLIQRVTAAVDPNDKQASATEILPSTNRIDYHIRFQNTGSDTAVKVTVVDTLDLTLPLTQIIINSASHPFQLSVVNNILIWEFDNIMLPDSAADPLGSQGFVRFSAGLNPSLGIGDTIDNDAEIYFDYQPPVHTNHAKTVIVQSISLPELSINEKQLDVYPNPAQSQLYIFNNANEDKHITLYTLSGQALKSFRVLSKSKTTLPLDGQSAGVYILRSETEAYRIVLKE